MCPDSPADEVDDERAQRRPEPTGPAAEDAGRVVAAPVASHPPAGAALTEEDVVTERVLETGHDPDSAEPTGRAPGGGSHDDGDPRVLRRAGRAAVLVLVAATILALVRLFLVQSFVIPSASMEPGLSAGDRVLVSRLDYRLGEIRRGDLIVFDGDGVFDPPRPRPASLLGRSGQALASALGLPVGEHDYVKRVIGLPGDRVACCDARGRLMLNGTPINEPYLPEGTVPSLIRFDVVVPPGRLWVMGDNRSVSGDSRGHLGDPGGGTVPQDHVVGRVVAVWWPLGSATGVGRVEAPQAPTAQ